MKLLLLLLLWQSLLLLLLALEDSWVANDLEEPEEILQRDLLRTFAVVAMAVLVLVFMLVILAPHESSRVIIDFNL